MAFRPRGSRVLARALGDGYRRASQDTPWLLPVFAAGAVAGGAAVFWWVSQGDRLQRPPLAREELSHPAAELGLPSGSETLRSFRGYVTSWDSRTRNPRWVAERLPKGGGERGGSEVSRSASSFVEDAALEPRFRARLEDYRNSGYDRGHLAPAGSHKGSQEELDETFNMSNISPQVGAGFNRDYWARLEKWTKDLSKANDVYIVSGPLFLPVPHREEEGGVAWRMEHGFIGKPPRLVGVPSHYFKVVCVADGKRARAIAAFVLPNSAIPPATPLRSFVVPVHALEEAAGLRFFDGALDGAEEREAFSAREAAWLDGRLLPEKSGGAAQLLLPPPAPHGAVPALPLPAARGMPMPLCAMEACVLPAENWWEAHKSPDERRSRKAALPPPVSSS